MKELGEIPAQLGNLTIGLDDILVINIQDDMVDSGEIDKLRNALIQHTPTLKDRVMILYGNVQLAVIKEGAKK